MLLSLPLMMLIMGILKIKRLVRHGELVFMRYPSRTFKQVWAEFKEHGNCTSLKGIKNKTAFVFIALSDKRFTGDWAKKTPEAKFWGFFMVCACGVCL